MRVASRKRTGSGNGDEADCALAYFWPGIAVLATAERHLGHALKIGKLWHAYDTTHAGGQEGGFRLLGKFYSCEEALVAIENQAPTPQTKKTAS